jgi:hypothetical protein
MKRTCYSLSRLLAMRVQADFAERVTAGEEKIRRFVRWQHQIVTHRARVEVQLTRQKVRLLLLFCHALAALDTPKRCCTALGGKPARRADCQMKPGSHKPSVELAHVCTRRRKDAPFLSSQMHEVRQKLRRLCRVERHIGADRVLPVTFLNSALPRHLQVILTIAATLHVHSSVLLYRRAPECSGCDNNARLTDFWFESLASPHAFFCSSVFALSIVLRCKMGAGSSQLTLVAYSR